MSFEIVSDKIKKAVDFFNMLNENDSVLVGFSGGKDSVVLLYMLKKLEPFYNVKVSALHVNHSIRGEEADRDEKFCEEFCKEHNIPFFKERVSAPKYAKDHKIGLEEAARILRYDAFQRIAKTNGITKIATAHTSSDNTETLIFNITRGTSAEGLKGIPPLRDNIIRPLIYCTTDNILKCAENMSLKYVTDSTNSDTVYTRNGIRHKIVPLIKEINPNVEEAFSNMCDLMRYDVDFINGFVKEIKDNSPKALSNHHFSVLSRYLIKLYKEKSEGAQLSSTHIFDMITLIKEYVSTDCKCVKQLSLPGKINFVCEQDRIYFQRAERDKDVKLEKHDLCYGLNVFEEADTAIFISENENDINKVLSKNIYKNFLHTTMKKSAFTGTIFARGRLDGDTFSFSNMTKKVKKMLNEAKIPLKERKILPMVCDNEGIFWIPSFPLRDNVKPSLNDDIIHLYYLKRREEK